jgi:hypothetical protein
VHTPDTYNYWDGDHYHDEEGPKGVHVGGRDVDVDHPAEPEAPTLVDPARDKLEAQGNFFFYVYIHMIHRYIRIHTYDIYMYTCMHTAVYIYTHTCFMCLYICIICMYAYIGYTHTHTHTHTHCLVLRACCYARGQPVRKKNIYIT